MEGDVKKESKEFVYDYSYWSVAERDPHFVNQEQVKTTSLLCVFMYVCLCMCVYICMYVCTYVYVIVSPLRRLRKF